MWEVGVEEFDDENPLRLEFSVTFQLERRDSSIREDIDNKDTAYLELYRYYVCLQRFKVFAKFGVLKISCLKFNFRI